jgi:prepilin-type N-terminal cleavage/methylation domain-containing protein
MVKKNNKGFTIIEVLIVLAIAGLIMLIVFLAVPALQRNSRNTQRKNEVAGILGAVNEWTNNNNGKLPSSIGTERADALSNAKTQIYTANITWQTGAYTNATSTETAVIVTGATCSGANAVAGGARNLVILYKVETGGGTGQFMCQES